MLASTHLRILGVERERPCEALDRLSEVFTAKSGVSLFFCLGRCHCAADIYCDDPENALRRRINAETADPVTYKKIGKK